MTNHEDLMATALEAVEQAETRANGAQSAELDDGNAADLSSDVRSESGMGDTEQAAAFDLDIDLDLDLELSGSDSSLPNLGKDLIAKLTAQKNAKSDAPTVAGAKTPAAEKVQSTQPSSKPASAVTTGAQAGTTGTQAGTTGAQASTTGAQANATGTQAGTAGAQAIPKPAPKIVLPQIGALKSTPNEAQAAQAQTPTQAKYMMLENLVQAQKVRIASLENEIEEIQQKSQAVSTAEIDELHAQNKALNDRIVRISADFDNYRKRVLRDQDQNKEQAEERIVTGFLPVIDNLERALNHARQSNDFEKLLQGVEMTYRLYLQTLGKLGCTPFESLGQNCDPNYHDVLQRVIDDEKEHNTIVQEHLKGYIMHDRVLRPALVVVSQHSQEPTTDKIED